MEYTKGEKWKIAYESHTGDLFIKNDAGRFIALANKNYADLIATAPRCYEALKMMLEGSEIAPLRADEPIRVWERAMPSEEAILYGFKALALAEGRSEDAKR